MALIYSMEIINKMETVKIKNKMETVKIKYKQYKLNIRTDFRYYYIIYDND